MAKDVLRSEGNLNNSSCSDEGVVLHSRLISHQAGLPGNIRCGGEVGTELYPGYGLPDAYDRGEDGHLQSFGEGEGRPH